MKTIIDIAFDIGHDICADGTSGYHFIVRTHSSDVFRGVPETEYPRNVVVLDHTGGVPTPIIPLSSIESITVIEV